MLYLNMIEANELRIGNFIHVNENYHIVEEIKIKSTRCSYTRTDTKQLHCSIIENEFLDPIPLTEEILLKCGFIKKQSTWSFNEIEISSWFTFKFSLDPLKVQELNYLHQLQNLYFALTGEELEVNLS